MPPRFSTAGAMCPCRECSADHSTDAMSFIRAGERPSILNGALALATKTPNPFRLLKPNTIVLVAEAADPGIREVDLPSRRPWSRLQAEAEDENGADAAVRPPNADCLASSQVPSAPPITEGELRRRSRVPSRARRRQLPVARRCQFPRNQRRQRRSDDRAGRAASAVAVIGVVTDGRTSWSSAGYPGPVAALRSTLSAPVVGELPRRHAEAGHQRRVGVNAPGDRLSTERRSSSPCRPSPPVATRRLERHDHLAQRYGDHQQP